jgi:hypothetical protein
MIRVIRQIRVGLVCLGQACQDHAYNEGDNYDNGDIWIVAGLL